MRTERNARRIRPANVTIGTSLFAVPASAVAITGVAAAAGFPGAVTDQPQPLSAEFSPEQVAYGGAVRASGALPAAAAGHPLSLQAATGTGGTYRTLARTRVGRSGHFTLTGHLRRTSFVRVAETSGRTEAISRVVRVSVRPELHVAHRALAALGGQPVGVRGGLLPRLAGRRIELEGRSHHAWRNLASTRTGAAGGFRFRYVPHGTGTHRLRILFAGDASEARAERGMAVTVFRASLASWYYDAGSTACGFHAAHGVANLGLPCGSKVTFRYRGRTVHAVVDDRGPYVGGREWDLSQSTAAALGFGGVGEVWSSR